MKPIVIVTVRKPLDDPEVGDEEQSSVSADAASAPSFISKFIFLLLLLASLFLISSLGAAIFSITAWRGQLVALRERVISQFDDAETDSQKMRAVLRYIESNVGYDYHESYFLWPIFRPLRPTAFQVLEKGGDCAYRARLFIVLSSLIGLKAHKTAVYNKQGNSVHAVVSVETERGRYLVDMLYNIIHQDEFGQPLSVEQLSEPAVLRKSVAREIAAGNPEARHYDFEEYALGDLRTVNWSRNSLFRNVYIGLSWVFGEDAVRQIRRPAIVEYPALMVAFMSLCFALLNLVGIVVLRVASKRRATRLEQDNPRLEALLPTESEPREDENVRKERLANESQRENKKLIGQV